MGDARRTHPPPRAGPVAGLPIDSLLERADDVARRWAISLVLARPLDGLGELPLEELAREAPDLCRQAMRALESDEELDRLTGAGQGKAREDSAPARRLALIAGAGDPHATVEAAEALRGALWETILEEVGWPAFDQLSSRRVADLSDRLAFVCSSMVGAGLASSAVQAGAPDAATPAPGAATPADSGAPGRREPAAVRRAVIVDEREGAVPARDSSAEIEIRDARAEAGPAAWIGSIGRQLERFSRDARPFAILLVEVGEPERMPADGPPVEASARANQIEHALASEIRAWSSAAREEPAAAGPAPGPGSLTRERPGRYWLLVPDSDRPRARALSDRLLEAIGRLARRSGARLQATVGMAVCPEDGREPAVLAAHADIELYTARSSAAAARGPSAHPDL